jgi:type IX secretion system PorP/SprF family membrane protein
MALCAAVNSNSFAQDATFSQNFSNPLSFNPAYAGSFGCSRLALDYRNQFPSVSYNYITYCASYDQYVKPLAGGLGLIFTSLNEEKGTFVQNSINGMYALNIRVSDVCHIRPAINVGFGENSVDLENPPPDYKKSVNYFNIGAGLLFAYKNFVAGVAYDHINQPDIGFLGGSDLGAKLTLHCNFQIRFDNNTNLTPGFIYQHQYSENIYLPSLMLKLWYIKLGAEFRLGPNIYHSIIPMIGFVNKWLSLSYSYDYIIPSTDNETPNKGTGGIHEITAVFKFNCRNKAKYGITHLYSF